MKTILILFIGLIVIGISTGTVYALITHNDSVLINGNLTVEDGNIVVNRDDGNDTGFTLRNNGGGANTFQFYDEDSNQVYRLTLNKNGNEFSFFDVTQGRKDIAVNTVTGNIGVGTTSPSERLDVIGNIRTTGDLVGSSGMKIIPNGDICIGSSC